MLRTLQGLVGTALLLAMFSCTEKTRTPLPAGPTAVPTVQRTVPADSSAPFNYKSPHGLLAALGTIKATFIITNSLLADEATIRSYCSDIAKKGYNLAFVNVQARGYYLTKKGVLINTPLGNVLLPGHPAMKVDDPIAILRSECSKQSRPVAVVPWFEYNAMAEQESGTSNPARGKGYNEKGELVSVGVYNEGSDKPTLNYTGDKQLFYPSSWYLKDPQTQKTYLSKSGLRWLDSRKTQVTNFLFNFAQHVASAYGPLQNWDRVRFMPDAGLGLEAERANKNNAQTKFIQRLSSMLTDRGGALWVTVVKHAVVSSKGVYNELFGQYWATEAWANAAQLIVPMTYFDTVSAYQADLAKIIEESEALKFKVLPIIGLDADIATMRKPENASILQQQRDETLRKVGTTGISGYADWYYWPN